MLFSWRCESLPFLLYLYCELSEFQRRLKNWLTLTRSIHMLHKKKRRSNRCDIIVTVYQRHYTILRLILRIPTINSLAFAFPLVLFCGWNWGAHAIWNVASCQSASVFKVLATRQTLLLYSYTLSLHFFF